MRKIPCVYAIALGGLSLLGSACVANGQQKTPQKTWTGYVTDTHCGTHCQAQHHDTRPPLSCVQICVKKGSKYGLWSGDKVYVLDPQPEAAHFAAQQVKITGTITGNTIHATSITSAEPSPPSALRR